MIDFASVPSHILTQFITQNPDGGYRMWRKMVIEAIDQDVWNQLRLDIESSVERTIEGINNQVWWELDSHGLV